MAHCFNPNHIQPASMYGRVMPLRIVLPTCVSLYWEVGKLVLRLLVTRTIRSALGYKVSEVYRRMSAKSDAVWVCVTTASLLPGSGSEIMKKSADTIAHIHRIHFLGCLGTHGMQWGVRALVDFQHIPHDETICNSCDCAVGSLACVTDIVIHPGFVFWYMIQLQRYLCMLYAVIFSAFLHEYFQFLNFFICHGDNVTWHFASSKTNISLLLVVMMIVIITFLWI